MWYWLSRGDSPALAGDRLHQVEQARNREPRLNPGPLPELAGSPQAGPVRGDPPTQGRQASGIVGDGGGEGHGSLRGRMGCFDKAMLLQRQHAVKGRIDFFCIHVPLIEMPMDPFSPGQGFGLLLLCGSMKSLPEDPREELVNCHNCTNCINRVHPP